MCCDCCHSVTIRSSSYQSHLTGVCGLRSAGLGIWHRLIIRIRGPQLGSTFQLNIHRCLWIMKTAADHNPLADKPQSTHLWTSPQLQVSG